MWAILNNSIFIDEQQIRTESWSRDRTEQSGAGIDGVVSIALGLRSRKVIQRGVLRGRSTDSLEKVIRRIESLWKAGEIQVRTERGQVYRHLIMEFFVPGPIQFSGIGARCNFEIEYSQLKRGE